MQFFEKLSICNFYNKKKITTKRGVKKVHKDWLCLEFAPAVLFSQKKLVCDEVEVIEFFVKFRFQI